MEFAELLPTIAVLFGIGLSVPLLIQFVHGVSGRMSQSGINAQQENTRISKEG